MKRILLIILSALMLVLPFAGCSGGSAGDNGGKLRIVTTVFPIYDWLRELTGEDEDIELTMLLDNGADLHSYQPTADDMIKISSCDMFVYVGGESDKWVDDALKESVNSDMVSVKLSDVLADKLREEELVEGMQGEEEEEEEDGEPEYDEHIWLSLKNAELCCAELSARLREIDSKHADSFEANYKSYSEKLKALDGDYEKAVKAAKYDTLLFGDRFPFRYLTEDYSLKYYAAFIGCSAETEASFKTIRFLSDKLVELGLPAVITLEKSDKKIAQTLIDTSGRNDVEILSLDSMQSVTSENLKQGTNYISVMEKNLETLKEALESKE